MGATHYCTFMKQWINVLETTNTLRTVMLCNCAVSLNIQNSKVSTDILILHRPPLTFKSVVLLSPAAAFPVSLLGGFILFLVQLTGAHVFGALVVVCNKSQINAACCHKRDWSTTRNTEQMDTKVWLLEKYFPLVLQAPLLLSVTEGKNVHSKKNSKDEDNNYITPILLVKRHITVSLLLVW